MSDTTEFDEWIHIKERNPASLLLMELWPVPYALMVIIPYDDPIAYPPPSRKFNHAAFLDLLRVATIDHSLLPRSESQFSGNEVWFEPIDVIGFCDKNRFPVWYEFRRRAYEIAEQTPPAPTDIDRYFADYLASQAKEMDEAERVSIVASKSQKSHPHGNAENGKQDLLALMNAANSVLEYCDSQKIAHVRTKDGKPKHTKVASEMIRYWGELSKEWNLREKPYSPKQLALRLGEFGLNSQKKPQDYRMKK